MNAPSSGLTTTDGVLNGATTRLDAVAYINNDTDPATATQLFGIDSATDTLYSLIANAGTTTAVGSGLGFNAIGVAGMDVSGVTGTTYSSMTDGATGKSGLFTINLATGSATWVGEIGIGGNTAIAPPLLDLSVAAIPEPESYALLFAGLLGVAWVSRRRRTMRD